MPSSWRRISRISWRRLLVLWSLLILGWERRVRIYWYITWITRRWGRIIICWLTSLWVISMLIVWILVCRERHWNRWRGRRLFPRTRLIRWIWITVRPWLLRVKISLLILILKTNTQILAGPLYKEGLDTWLGVALVETESGTVAVLIAKVVDERVAY